MANRTIRFVNWSGQADAIYIRLQPNRWWGGKTGDGVNLPGVLAAHTIMTDLSLLQLIGDIAVMWPGEYKLEAYEDGHQPNFTVISRTMDARILSDVLDLEADKLIEYYGYSINMAQERADQRNNSGPLTVVEDKSYSVLEGPDEDADR